MIDPADQGGDPACWAHLFEGNATMTIVGDVDTPTQVNYLVTTFYREIVFDELLEPVFSEVAETDWASHIPKLIDYWCRVLLHKPGYDGYIVAAHRHVHGIEAFRLEHFDRWYRLWIQTIDAGWAGPIADQAKSHAARMGKTLARQVLGVEWVPPSVDRSGTG